MCEPIVEVTSIDEVLKTCTVQYYRITVRGGLIIVLNNVPFERVPPSSMQPREGERRQKKPKLAYEPGSSEYTYPVRRKAVLSETPRTNSTPIAPLKPKPLLVSPCIHELTTELVRNPEFLKDTITSYKQIVRDREVGELKGEYYTLLTTMSKPKARKEFVRIHNSKPNNTLAHIMECSVTNICKIRGKIRAELPGQVDADDKRPNGLFFSKNERLSVMQACVHRVTVCGGADQSC